MNIRIFGYEAESYVDGPGVRASIFVQGCPHHCAGCHNPESRSFDGGRMMDTEDFRSIIFGNPLLSGVTITGGEPFMQPAACTEIAKMAHEAGLNVWLYTGFTYEQIISECGEYDYLKRIRAESMELLYMADVLVDGRYEQNKRSLEIMWRGSRNQRLIDIRKTRLKGEVVLYDTE